MQIHIARVMTKEHLVVHTSVVVAVWLLKLRLKERQLSLSLTNDTHSLC